MNCSTCGIKYQDDVPHPPAKCAKYAGEELVKARKALDGALEQISIMAKERDELLNPREVNLALDSVSRNYSRLRELSGVTTPTKEMEELRLFHMKLLKWKRKEIKDVKTVRTP